MAFAVNEGGQVYAKDFICTNSRHSYNICQQIEALWTAIHDMPSCSDDEDECNSYGCLDSDCPGYGGSGCVPEGAECTTEGGGCSSEGGGCSSEGDIHDGEIENDCGGCHGTGD